MPFLKSFVALSTSTFFLPSTVTPWFRPCDSIYDFRIMKQQMALDWSCDVAKQPASILRHLNFEIMLALVRLTMTCQRQACSQSSSIGGQVCCLSGTTTATLVVCMQQQVQGQGSCCRASKPDLPLAFVSTTPASFAHMYVKLVMCCE